jgi:hypothetical protein
MSTMARIMPSVEATLLQLQPLLDQICDLYLNLSKQSERRIPCKIALEGHRSSGVAAGLVPSAEVWMVLPELLSLCASIAVSKLRGKNDKQVDYCRAIISASTAADDSLQAGAVASAPTAASLAPAEAAALNILVSVFAAAGMVPAKDYPTLAMKLISEGVADEIGLVYMIEEDPDFLKNAGMKAAQRSCLVRHLKRPLFRRSKNDNALRARMCECKFTFPF